MPLSRYLKIWPCPDRADHFILYSTRKGSVTRLSSSGLAAAREGCLSPKSRETLERLTILVDDQSEERREMAELVNLTNGRDTNFFAKVVMNLDCNLACPYCFEDDFRHRQYMTSDTADRLLEFIEKEQISRGHDVELRFYGGEPLLSLSLLEDIARRAGDAAARKSVSFSFTMTTNGTLLTRRAAEMLAPLGMKSATVTLDGPPEIHNRQRPFVSGKGSFAAILDNIRSFKDIIRVEIGGNYAPDSYQDFPRMLDHILGAGIHPTEIGPVEFAPIMPKAGRSGAPESGCASSSQPWIWEAALFLREETLKRGFSVNKPTQAACAIEFNNNLVVNYDGTLFKCPAFMGWPEMSVGTLSEGIRDYRQSHNMDVWKNDECLDCAYLPLCFGGCRLFPLMKHGVIDRVDCRKAYYDAVLQELVMQDLRYASPAHAPAHVPAPAD